jgi:hypothetical protein
MPANVIAFYFPVLRGYASASRFTGPAGLLPSSLPALPGRVRGTARPRCKCCVGDSDSIGRLPGAGYSPPLYSRVCLRLALRCLKNGSASFAPSPAIRLHKPGVVGKWALGSRQAGGLPAPPPSRLFKMPLDAQSDSFSGKRSESICQIK